MFKETKPSRRSALLGTTFGNLSIGIVVRASRLRLAHGSGVFFQRNLDQAWQIVVRIDVCCVKDPTVFACEFGMLLQSVELPLSEFTRAVPAFAPEDLCEIRFVFDRSPAGAIVLDRIGLTEK